MLHVGVKVELVESLEEEEERGTNTKRRTNKLVVTKQTIHV